jgi:hypothetical protein
MIRRVRMPGAVYLRIPEVWDSFTYNGDFYVMVRQLDNGTWLARRV